jgi:hypothetical protein
VCGALDGGRFAEEGIEEALTYPEFLEVLAAVAEAVYKYACCPVVGRCRFLSVFLTHLAVCRFDDTLSLFQKLQQMFFLMSDSGFEFRERELKVFQSVRRAVKATLL